MNALTGLLLYVFSHVFSLLGEVELASLVLVFLVVGLSICGAALLPTSCGKCKEAILQIYWLFFIGALAIPPMGVLLAACENTGELATAAFYSWLVCVGMMFGIISMQTCLCGCFRKDADQVWLFPIDPLIANFCGRLLWPLMDLLNLLTLKAAGPAYPYPVPEDMKLSEKQIRSLKTYLLNYPKDANNTEVAALLNVGNMYAFYDELDAVAPQSMIGKRFRGQTLPVSLLDRVKRLQQNWGKSFNSKYAGNPLIIWCGNRAMPLPIWGNVTMTKVEDRGVSTAAMTYNEYAWQDHFRQLGFNTDGYRVLLGTWEANGSPGGFFLLTDSVKADTETSGILQDH